MKRIILSLAILASVSMGLSAQNEGKIKERKGRNPMAELNLTTDQQAQMKSLRENYQAKRKELSDAYKKDMEKILTPEQKTKWETVQKERAERHNKGDRGRKKKGNRESANKVPNSKQTSTTNS